MGKTWSEQKLTDDHLSLKAPKSTAPTSERRTADGKPTCCKARGSTRQGGLQEAPLTSLVADCSPGLHTHVLAETHGAEDMATAWPLGGWSSTESLRLHRHHLVS